MTRLALGGKSNGLTTPLDCGFADWAPSKDELSSEFNAVTPSPADARPRNALRLAWRASWSSMVLVPRVDFVKIQYHSRHRCHGRQLCRALIICQRGLAFAQKVAGALRVGS